MFISYSNLEDMRDARKRSQINAYVNRGRKVNKVKSSAQRHSRPPLEWQARRTARTSPPVEVEPESLAQAKDVADVQDPRHTEDSTSASQKRRRLPKLPLQYGPGGLRRDPFASFPIAQSGQVEWAVDFFLQDYATMNESIYSDESGRNWLTGTLFPLALQSDMLFAAVILSMARYSHVAGSNALVPGGVHFLHLRSSVLGRLHWTLSQDKEISTSDTTINTLICLIAADFFAGHDDHAATHLRGLQMLVALRGGLEHGNFDRQTKYNLSGTHAICSFAEQRLQKASAPVVKSEPELSYPVHPFSQQLCTEIATLPRGISDIALDGRISTQIIKILCRLTYLAKGTVLPSDSATTDEFFSVSNNFVTFIARANITSLERSLCIFCWLFLLRKQPNRNRSQTGFGQFLVDMRRRIRKMAKSFMSLEGADPDYATWGVAILVVDNTPERTGLTEAERSEVFEELVCRHPVARRWKETVNSLQKFFFLDAWVEEYRGWWDKEMGRCRKRFQQPEYS
ncbi:uncharacterized protein Z520_04029 [Fonsecaea multimorphosa CBS 102226]|uniref:Transcription factor domain-containing protein n=1 Tax=Fonsecaea multimorphosa CBS 102226 TaxID=1442371 RepID=A0A0D2KUC2_9EURO|nr:uncharacterized protein Z520_04029 [Fonsecaea multimorphosa CBS 102226]KIY00344.1 hypothetical protein Z520_04029 [Fonsecaea multimorphosa CBS 102226]